MEVLILILVVVGLGAVLHDVRVTRDELRALHGNLTALSQRLATERDEWRRASLGRMTAQVVAHDCERYRATTGECMVCIDLQRELQGSIGGVVDGCAAHTNFDPACLECAYAQRRN